MTNVLQKPADNHEARGRLDPNGFYRHVTFHTYTPPSNLLAFVEHFWTISWDKIGNQPYISQQVMHRPYVDLYISKDESGIQGTFRGMRAYKAAGRGRIIGVRFRPGAFHAFWDKPISDLQDKIINLQQVFSEADEHYIKQLLLLDDQAAINALVKMIRDKNPQQDPNIDLINEVIRVIDEDKNLQTVTAIAKQFLKSERWIQQLFHEYVGVGLKWLLQRNKLLEAAKYIQESKHPNWASIAYDLAYSSQQHFITDFKRVLGKTPAEYKKELASG